MNVRQAPQGRPAPALRLPLELHEAIVAHLPLKEAAYWHEAFGAAKPAEDPCVRERLKRANAWAKTSRTARASLRPATPEELAAVQAAWFVRAAPRQALAQRIARPTDAFRWLVNVVDHSLGLAVATGLAATCHTAGRLHAQLKLREEGRLLQPDVRAALAARNGRRLERAVLTAVAAIACAVVFVLISTPQWPTHQILARAYRQGSLAARASLFCALVLLGWLTARIAPTAARVQEVGGLGDVWRERVAEPISTMYRQGFFAHIDDVDLGMYQSGLSTQPTCG